MRVLSVTSEIYPLVKTGGLADVAGALPPALARRGILVRSLVPGYGAVMEALGPDPLVLHRYPDLLGAPARLLAATVGELALIVLDAPAFFDRRGGPYSDPDGTDFPDNWRRFAALSRAGADIAGGLLPDFIPDVVHAHDWQAALTPAYMRYAGVHRPSIVTVHNLAFQGHFPASIFGELGLPPQAFAIDGVEYYGGVGFLKAGLQNAWAISTVSPTYAAEIRTAEFGMGLERLIAGRASTLSGIVNGIDTEVWNPETDPHLAARFSAADRSGRAQNRQAVCERFGLEAGSDPIFCVISRMTWQKGIDLLAAVTEDLVAVGARLAVLGSGDAEIEQSLLALAKRHRGRVAVEIGYDEPLAHLMQGGADAILIPSRFEPCGLTQLYGLRYGCVPVVARVGGLADTVIDANTAALNADVATGVQFAPVDEDALRTGIRRTMALFRDPERWASIQNRGMVSDVSWDRSAALYAELYARLAPSAEGTAA